MSSTKAHEARHNQIIRAGVRAAARMGYPNVTASEIAASIGVSPSLIQKHFPLMADLKDAIVNSAFAHGDAKVIAQAFSLGHPRAAQSDDTAKAKALDFIREA